MMLVTMIIRVLMAVVIRVPPVDMVISMLVAMAAVTAVLLVAMTTVFLGG